MIMCNNIAKSLIGLIVMVNRWKEFLRGERENWNLSERDVLVNSLMFKL
jgi:hypothetical protein